jgi:hypothetical protein
MTKPIVNFVRKKNQEVLQYVLWLCPDCGAKCLLCKYTYRSAAARTCLEKCSSKHVLGNVPQQSRYLKRSADSQQACASKFAAAGIWVENVLQQLHG